MLIKLIKKLLFLTCVVAFFNSTVQAVPTLSWPSGDAQLVFEHIDGNIIYNTIVHINYMSPEHSWPKVTQLWIDLNDDGIYATADERMDLFFEPLNPFSSDPSQPYTARTNLISSINVNAQYRFNWTDMADRVATGAPVVGVNFVTVATYNYMPVLDYSDAPHFADSESFVFPKAIENEGTFLFRVKYRDQGNEAPLSACVYLDVDMDGIYQPSECYTLVPDVTSSNYASGIDYAFSIYLASSVNVTYKYYLEFKDEAFTVTTNESEISLLYSFIPYVDYVNEVNYTSSILYPTAGTSGDTFHFRVNYFSGVNQLPSFYRLWIDFDANGTFNVNEWVPFQIKNSGDENYADGKEFYADVTLYQNGVNVGTPIMYWPEFLRGNGGLVTGNASDIATLNLGYVQDKPLILDNNYPNPFGRASDAVTHFSYYLKSHSDVSILIFNVGGKKVKEFSIPAGLPGARKGFNCAQTWDGRDEQGDYVLNGVYLYVVKVGKNKEVKKLVFLR